VLSPISRFKMLNVTTRGKIILFNIILIVREWSSVSIVTGYRLERRGSVPDKGRGFFL
jgi:hypothetical protein